MVSPEFRRAEYALYRYLRKHQFLESRFLEPLWGTSYAEGAQALWDRREFELFIVSRLGLQRLREEYWEWRDQESGTL